MVGRRRGEELLTEVVEALGPVVAIGRPGEKVPPLGAARLYVGDNWKQVVQDYMRKSQLVLMVAGTTTHFAWEIGEVFRNEPFVPTIIVLPFFRKYSQEQVDRFVSAFDSASGLNLPSDLRNIRAAYFPDRATVLTIADDGSPTEEELNRINPFLGALARIMELTRPGWSSSYLAVARERRSNRWRAIKRMASVAALWVFAVIALALVTLIPH
jgi:hypothetical protein